MGSEKKLLLFPAEGRMVRDPETGRPLEAAGEEKPDTQFWRRRLRDGDVISKNGSKAPKKDGKK